MVKFHVSQDETGNFQLAYEDEGGELTLVSHDFITPDQLVEDAMKLAASGKFGQAIVVVDPVRRAMAFSADAASASDDIPAPRRADQ